MPAMWTGAPAEKATVGFRPPPGLCDVPQTFGTLQVGCQGCGVPLGETAAEACADGGQPSQLRSRNPFKNKGVRRNSDPGSASSPVPQRQASADGEIKGAISEPFAARPLYQAASGLHGRCSEPVEPTSFGPPAPIPPSPRRSFDGLLGGPPQPSRSSEAGQMAGPSVSTTLRERGQAKSAFGQPPRRCPAKSNFCRRSHRPTVCQPAFAAAASVSNPIFLEIFSGTGKLAKAVCRYTGWSGGLVDILHGVEYDLRSPKVQNHIIGMIRGGTVLGVHLGLECKSFSRARDRRPGPPPLRSDSQPMGLPNLREADERKVKDGNFFLRFTCRVCRLCHRLQIPFTVENPGRSRLWICPPMLQVMRFRRVHSVDVDYCYFGTRWKKRTKFLYFGLDLSEWCQFQCKQSKRGICAFTGLPHFPLMGTNDQGVFLTKVAEPYPQRLCNAHARAMWDWHASATANKFWARLQPEGNANTG